MTEKTGAQILSELLAQARRVPSVPKLKQIKQARRELICKVAEIAASAAAPLKKDRAGQVLVMQGAVEGALVMLAGVLSPARLDGVEYLRKAKREGRRVTEEEATALTNACLTHDDMLYAALMAYASNTIGGERGPGWHPGDVARELYEKITGRVYLDSLVRSCMCPGCETVRDTHGATRQQDDDE